ncbi:hypothetical protein [Streptomyces sp. NPDC002132]
MNDEIPEPDGDDFDDVLGDIEDLPADEYRLSTRPGAVSGEA